MADTNDGACDTDCSLREALAVAAPGSIIEFASGLSGTITLKSTLTINKNLTINGPITKPLTISGRNAIRVFYIDSGVHFVIRNVTIANGSVKGKSGLAGATGQPGGTGSTAEGAGLYNNGGIVTVENSTFLNNIVKGGSGGKGGFSGTFRCRKGGAQHIFAAGKGGMGGDGLGGGVYNSGTLFLINSTFSRNIAIGGIGGDGGAFGAIEEWTSCTPGGGRTRDDLAKETTGADGMIRGAGGNGGNGYGGAIHSASDAWIISCTFAANSAIAGVGGMGDTVGRASLVRRYEYSRSKPKWFAGHGLGWSDLSTRRRAGRHVYGDQSF